MWWRFIDRVSSLRDVGCLLAWILVQTEQLGEEVNSKKFQQSVFERLCKPHGASRRARGAVFPLRVGHLEPLRTTLMVCSLQEVVSSDFCRKWSEDAWSLCVFTGINGMSASLMPLAQGPWTAFEERAQKAVNGAVKRFLSPEATCLWSAEKLAADMREKRVSFSGEEQAQIHELSVEQVVAALPPLEHGGSIALVDLLSEGSRRLLENPTELVLPDEGQKLPKLQAKVHCRPEEKLSLAIVARGTCGWTELSDVIEMRGTKVLSGMFGIEKSSCLPDGRHALRLIMNLIPINSILRTIQGRVRGLPSITSWMSISSDSSQRSCTFGKVICALRFTFSGYQNNG